MIELLNCDCMEYMKTLDDNAFELAIVDPPYGLGMANEKPRKDGRFAMNKPRNWDDAIPEQSYFDELERVSVNRIIWGGNYFPLPPTQGFIFWHKKNPVDNFSDGELAWTSFSRPAKCFDFAYYGNIQGCTSADKKIHISQKPIELYQWLLKNYSKEGDRILDTHLGSGSSAIAAHYGGFDFVGCELDKDYFNAAKERIDNETRQKAMF